MKLTPSSTLNTALKKIADGNNGAASVLGMIAKDYPHVAMKYFHRLDELELYGHPIWDALMIECSGSIELFFKKLIDGNISGREDRVR